MRDFALLGLLCIAISAPVWTLIVLRWQRGHSVLPYQPRRSVPWNAGDLLLIVLVHWTLLVVAGGIAAEWLTPALKEMLPAPSDAKSTTMHPIVQLVLTHNPWLLLAAAFSAAIVAPLVEESFFRLLLQGWLEGLARRYRRVLGTIGRSVPRAVIPILAVSLLFGARHHRPPMTPEPATVLAHMLAGSVASLVTLGFALPFLRLRARATAADLGWVAEKFWSDVLLGLTAFLAVGPPLYLMQTTLGVLLGKGVAPDPLTIFLFACVLGTIYYRTHRITPVIVLHMSLNATSLAIAWVLQQ
jgi:membrane protease YdiL (CAAX protease family)